MFLMDNVEFLILRNLLHNEEYIRKVIPFIKADYFEDITQKIVFEEISRGAVHPEAPLQQLQFFGREICGLESVLHEHRRLIPNLRNRV